MEEAAAAAAKRSQRKGKRSGLAAAKEEETAIHSFTTEGDEEAIGLEGAKGGGEKKQCHRDGGGKSMEKSQIPKEEANAKGVPHINAIHSYVDTSMPKVGGRGKCWQWVVDPRPPLPAPTHITPLPSLSLLPKLSCGAWGKIFAGNGSQLDPSGGAAQLLTKPTQQWGEDISRHKCRNGWALFRHPPIATSVGGEA
ncbi:hypothetical protein niasHT_013628 [Heterodera trifolii]|uniref:Uncharacterized protein n=1 Tax=Heterodera trifolii TaxID=157864 RepID=A0ABD2LHF7_9BILA